MVLKVRCPRCRAEIADPPDPRSISCPCGAVFDGRNAPLAYWIGAAVLCVLVLVALAITAFRMKEIKMAARMSEEAPPPPEPPVLRLAGPTVPLGAFFERASRDHPGREIDVELDSDGSRQREVLEEAARRGVPVRFVVVEANSTRLQFTPGTPLRVEHFTIAYAGRDASFAISRPRGPILATFGPLHPGAVRRWHELELRILEIEPNRAVAEIALKPGSPCFGAGLYLLQRPGLRVEFPEGRSVTVVAWDPEKPEVTVRLESVAGREERTLGIGREGQAFGMTCGLIADKGSHALFLRFD